MKILYAIYSIDHNLKQECVEICDSEVETTQRIEYFIKMFKGFWVEKPYLQKFYYVQPLITADLTK